MIKRIRLMTSNAYLIVDERPILIDTGAPGNEGRILKAMATEGVAPRDLALIVHTHGHSDHAGSTAALQRATGAAIAIHRADASMMASGARPALRPSRLSARFWQPIVNTAFEGVQADVLLSEGDSLAPWGVRGHVLHTPGHTMGSITIVLDDGAIIGDIVMGGFAGGTLLPHLPRDHYFIDDRAALRTSLDRVLALNVEPFYVGHGGPLKRAALAARFGAGAITPQPAT